MRKVFIFVFLSLALTAAALALAARGKMPRQVSAGGHHLRMSILGQGSPAVILDSFGPANLEIWNRVQPEVARFARVVAYDHAGYWGSEPGPKPRDARRIALELHAALAAAGVPPPYVLAGFSFGGPYLRVFAGMYPQEVIGLCLIDPTQEEFMELFKTGYAKFFSISEEHRAAQSEWGCLWESLDQARTSAVPNVPVTLITGMARQDLLKNKLLPRWLESHRNWLQPFLRARHIVTTNSGHDVVLKEPDLVVRAIRDVIQAAHDPVPTSAVPSGVR